VTDPRTTPVPDDRVRSDVAHNARVWNHWLGGTDNYPVDRAVGDRVTALYTFTVDGPGQPLPYTGLVAFYTVAELSSPPKRIGIAVLTA
jgi:hypothetical protein